MKRNEVVVVLLPGGSGRSLGQSTGKVAAGEIDRNSDENATIFRSLAGLLVI